MLLYTEIIILHGDKTQFRKKKFPERPVAVTSEIRRRYKKFIRTGSVNKEKTRPFLDLIVLFL